jgi:CRISPR system Cascade subunit CasB
MNQKPYISFANPEEPDFAALEEWWKGLKQDTGGRARLRRSRSPGEVAQERAYYDLVLKMRAAGYEVGTGVAQRLATVAGLAAHVEQTDFKAPLAKQMATPREGQAKARKARVSEMRFRRLLKKPQAEDLYLPLMRVLKMLDRNCNLFDMARSVYWWEKQTTRQQWASDYYETAAKGA